MAGRYQLLTRAGCHLCDDMARLLDEVMRAARASATRRSTSTARATRRPRCASAIGDVVPVLLRDGVAVAKVRLDRAQLERILDEQR